MPLKTKPNKLFLRLLSYSVAWSFIGVFFYQWWLFFILLVLWYIPLIFSWPSSLLSPHLFVLFQAILFCQTVLFQTIQFSINMQLVLFNPLIGLYKVLPFRARVDLGAMAMKGCAVFPKAPASLEPHHQIV